MPTKRKGVEYVLISLNRNPEDNGEVRLTEGKEAVATATQTF